MIKPWARAAVIAVCAVTLANAQGTTSPYTPLIPMPLGDTLINLPTPRVLPQKVWEIRFTHRFSQPITDGDIQSFWGLDSSADIGIALSYAPVRDLQFTIYRTDVQDNYELAAKWVALQEARAIPLSLTIRGGANWRTEEGLTDRVSPFVQAIVSRQIGNRFELFAVPSFVADAPPFDQAFNIPFGLAFALKPGASLVFEITPPNGDVPDDVGDDFGWAIGWKRGVGGHYFEILLANTRFTHVDQYVTATPLGGLDAGDVRLGFNIERRWGGRR